MMDNKIVCGVSVCLGDFSLDFLSEDVSNQVMALIAMKPSLQEEVLVFL